MPGDARNAERGLRRLAREPLPGSRPPAPASRARRRRATESSRGWRATPRGSSARRSRASRGRRRESVCWRAMATVSSVLCESTTTISSAQATDASASPISAASFLVMTVTESFGTAGSVLEGGTGQVGQEGSEGRRAGGRKAVVPGRPYPAHPASACWLLSRNPARPAVVPEPAVVMPPPPPLSGTCCTASKSTSDLL